MAKTPTLQVLNKIDLLAAEERHDLTASPQPGVAPVSAHTGEGLDRLVRLIEEKIGGAGAADPTATAHFRIPQREGRTLAALEGGAFLENKRFEGNLIYFTAHGPSSLLQRYRRFIAHEHGTAPETEPQERPRMRTR